MILCVPPLKGRLWPTLGPQVCDFIEENLTFGPGDLLGEPARLDDEKRSLIYRIYEIYPKGHTLAGRRRFKRVAISLRKGSAKTEFAAWIAIAELHPAGPVRCVGWTKKGYPLGGPVNDPYIPMVAYTEEQSEELAYGAMRLILEHSPLADDFDIGLERIMRRHGYGKAEALATAPSSRDGARTTFQHFDETHHMSLPRLKKAHRAMLANIPKRRMADAWSLETTTAPAPGEFSVAEDTMEYAEEVRRGKIKDPRLFFFHRQASDKHDLTKARGLRAAVREASGPVAKWSDLNGIIDQWKDPKADKAWLERVWLNRLVRSAEQAFDIQAWKKAAKKRHMVEDGALITLGFDGARTQDATAIVGTEVETGYQWVLGVWERPLTAKVWEVPHLEVKDVMTDAFNRWDVWRLYADPPYWETTVAEWSQEFGEERVVAWRTASTRKMADAVRAYANAIADGDLSHPSDATFEHHIGNAHRRIVSVRDEKGEQLWTIYKERSDSPKKIDVAMAAILSWEARRDAISKGAGPEEPSVYEERGVLAF